MGYLTQSWWANRQAWIARHNMGKRDGMKAKTGAQRNAEYRARQKQISSKRLGGKSGRSKTKFDDGEFIALDGEGESTGELQTFTVGEHGKTYQAKEHIYTLLAASSGETLYNGGKRLATVDCLNFLCDLADSHKHAIFVIFAGSYDINHMLMFGFERDILQRISRGETYEFSMGGDKFSIEYRARKSLTIKRGMSYKIDANMVYKTVWKTRIVIWDVFGFFQESFVGVVEKWLGRDWPDYQLIKDMKLRRGDFADVEQSVINHYNAAELRALVAIMDKVRDAVVGLDLKCRRWDGAGSIAAAIMRKHDVKQYKCPMPDEIMIAARTAYAGGRIEICKVGCHKSSVYDYDVNSAYPSVMAELPCLAHGKWRHGLGSIPNAIGKFTLVHCKFDFADDLPFYPLFYRTDKMQISFPQQGEGWYWLPEYEAALQCPGVVEVVEFWTFEQKCAHKPFSWIPEYYETRQRCVKQPTERWHGGGEKIIKLGLNSLYGKTAQQLGGSKKMAPTYHQLEWAGYITSATRARLFNAAMHDPDSIIGFATDGIFTTRPLPIECSTTKKMGAWELKLPEPDGMTIAMAGVYWWHHGDKFAHFSRGFDKDSMRTPHPVSKAWARRQETLDIPMHRLIGMGSACTSDTLWLMRGRFTESMRTLRLDGKSHKRQGASIAKKPHEKLIDLRPNMNVEYMTGLQGCSFPYPVLWYDGEENEFGDELETIRENLDAENI